MVIQTFGLFKSLIFKRGKKKRRSPIKGDKEEKITGECSRDNHQSHICLLGRVLSEWNEIKPRTNNVIEQDDAERKDPWLCDIIK